MRLQLRAPEHDRRSRRRGSEHRPHLTVTAITLVSLPLRVAVLIEGALGVNDLVMSVT